ncbi:hypothetical protein H112_04479 [Trichophyton rubrum D6]|uniref:Uncharacterized protein n=2 Tax=Trichophyton TaxID=5550 RepID=A0A022W1S9_TRIRU|nr:hypothetical protein H100_04488 [Trichophyton rubrum MR850]EZF41831.1 hypothetical protein H102_04472 [Trichophyton rubrum CBS 100081]EZF52415.1 hypothetical protein H103_04484 [Trichophyton rubrum CBS 288.86]EZF63106.1 hypothetical protein H104_04470 [Trichophyton rubrum CBS 289.86]EZF73690.1 hypothetical protein H105_04496 [Trichophyton soudanense CBS 452.61]EZG06111.1 hypothetical protein H106_04297 [Trichophyton rubrum CBS 735.88]EZG16655.1 hypothetical protein H107_04602 [Trichophyton
MDVPRICIVVRRIYLQTYKTKPDGNANLGQPGILSKISLDNYSSLLHSGLSLPLDASPRRSKDGDRRNSRPSVSFGGGQRSWVDPIQIVPLCT